MTERDERGGISGRGHSACNLMLSHTGWLSRWDVRINFLCSWVRKVSTDSSVATRAFRYSNQQLAAKQSPSYLDAQTNQYVIIWIVQEQ